MEFHTFKSLDIRMFFYFLYNFVDNHIDWNSWDRITMKEKMHERTTKCISHKGFRGLRRSEVAFAFCVT